MSTEKREQLVELLAGFIGDEQVLQEALNGGPLVSALAMDSMRLLDLVVRLEERFGVSFEYADIDRALASFDSLLEHVSG